MDHPVRSRLQIPYHIIMKLLLSLALVSTSLLLSNCANGHCLFSSKKHSASCCSTPAAACCSTPAAKKTTKH
jgi:hypothetical protein